MKDGIFKWAYKTGREVRSTPAINENNVIFGSNDGTGYALNKYTGAVELAYNPGTYLFNSPISSSPVIYGKSLFFAGEDGYVYSLDSEKLEAPISIFVYYTAAIVIAILAILIVLITIIRRR